MKQDTPTDTSVQDSAKRVRSIGALISVPVVAFSVWLLWSVVSARQFSIGFTGLFVPFALAFIGAFVIAFVFSILLALGSPLRISAKNMVFEHGRIFASAFLLTYVPLHFLTSPQAAFAIAVCAYPVCYGILYPMLARNSDLGVPMKLVNSGAGNYFGVDFGEIRWENYPQTTNVTIIVALVSIFLFSIVGESIWQAAFAIVSSIVLTFFLKDSYVLRRYTVALGFLSISVSAWWLLAPI